LTTDETVRAFPGSTLNFADEGFAEMNFSFDKKPPLKQFSFSSATTLARISISLVLE
jgi:hypothetical protein